MSCPFHPQDDATNSPAAEAAQDEETSPMPDGLPIPHPPESWFTGNLQEIDPSFLASSIWRLADIYGPIYSLNFVSRQIIVISSYELINEVCDDTKYQKRVAGPLEKIRVLTKNGLFTAYESEEEWGIAHRTLVPAFGPLHVRTMFPKMADVVSQMVLRWDRFGPEHRISCAEDFTRLAFEVIGLCAFNYRFNAFYGDKLPEFAILMANTMTESGRQASRLELENWLRFKTRQKLMSDVQTMWSLCDKIVADRVAHPRPDVEDLLKVMLEAKDPVTGKGLTAENIRYQMVTFLIAGHETSAGTMSFLFYNLLQHPEKLQKCYAEVDAVVGNDDLDLSHLPKLHYIEAAIRETLRYMGPIALIQRAARKTTLLGGKYKVSPETPIMLNLKGLHHDPAVWGPDADEFKPERFLDGGWEKLPANAWKPFGNGLRACIGRYLAEQEIIMAMAMILQRFVVEMADQEYQLKIKATMTIKPDNFDIQVRRRPGKDHLFELGQHVPAHGTSKSSENTKTVVQENARTDAQTDHKPMAVYYGGNTGTCKSFSEDLRTNAPRFGFDVDAVKSLDEAVENLPKDRPVVIVTSSYEGQPPDNAKNFVAWLEALVAKGRSTKPLAGVKYTVFGLGNREWVTTFHRIPKLVDRLLETLGGTRLCEAGFVDVGQDILGPFESWKQTLFSDLRNAAGVTTAVKTDELDVQITRPDAPSKLAGQDISEGLVLENKVLSKGAGPEKRHMEILLPPGVEYSSGDYLVVRPFNPKTSVIRVMNRFGLHPDDLVSVRGASKEHLLGHDGAPISVFELLGSRVELALPASQQQVAQLAKVAQGDDATRLTGLASERLYVDEILQKRYSVLDLLEDFPSITLPFGAYLGMLAPLKPRQYSMSSSPLAKQALVRGNSVFDAKVENNKQAEPEAQDSLTASITYDVYSAPSHSNPSRPYHGVASNYLANLLPGTRLRCFVRRTQAPFRLPLDPKTPVILVAAGTGIAPMRAFVQDRVAIAAARPGGARANLGPALLYYGFRDAMQDYLYRDELLQAQADGVITVRAAASRRAVDGGPIGHVDELIWADRDELRTLFKAQAKILVCGSAARLGQTTQEVCLKIYEESHPGCSREEAQIWLLKQKEDRYVSDVFG